MIGICRGMWDVMLSWYLGCYVLVMVFGVDSMIVVIFVVVIVESESDCWHCGLRVKH